MKNFFLMTIINIIILIACQKDNKTTVNNLKITSQPIDTLKYKNEVSSSVRNDFKSSINDSLFIGIPQISDSIFIDNIRDGGKNFAYFSQYEKIMLKINKCFVNWECDKNISDKNINDNCTLELRRKKFSNGNKNKDIQIMLYTKINERIKDSILFYKYQWDKDFPTEQRFEHLSYIDSHLNIWSLETYTNHSEDALEVDKWEKYKIDTIRGRFILIRKFILAN